MRKFFLWAVAVLLLGLSACKGNAASAPTATTAPTPTTAEEFAVGNIAAECTASSSPAQKDLLLEGDWARGAEDPAVTIVIYSDFQCQPCANMAANLAQILEDFPAEVRVIYRYFPLIGNDQVAGNDKAALSAQAAEAAGLQDAFWEMHDILFTQQAEWTELSEADFIAWVTDQVETLGLDTEQFQTDMLSAELAQMAEQAWLDGISAGFEYIPYMFIDNRPALSEYYQYEALNKAVGSILIPLNELTDRQYNECPPQVIDFSKAYTAILHTDLGDITIELFPDVAPFTVNSFVFLAREDWFDDVKFHRVVPGFVAQAGDPSGTGLGGPGYLFGLETDPDLNFDRAGLFAMANSGPTANGSQFFITYDAAPHLNGQYTIFGEVIAGMDVARAIAEPTAEDPNSLPEVYILDVTIEEK